MIVEVQVEELLAPTLLPLSVASTPREVVNSPGTSPILSSLTPTLILAKAKVEGSFSSLLCSLGVCCRGELYPSIYTGK